MATSQSAFLTTIPVAHCHTYSSIPDVPRTCPEIPAAGPLHLLLLPAGRFLLKHHLMSEPILTQSHEYLSGSDSVSTPRPALSVFTALPRPNITHIYWVICLL